MVIIFAQELSNYLVDSKKMLFSDIFKFDNSRKKGHKLFFNGKFALFSQKFSPTSEVLKNWSHSFHSNCQKTLWTLIKCSLKFLLREKTVNRFFSEESLPCSSKIFIFNNLLGPKRMLQVPQYRPKQLVNLKKNFLTFVMFDFTGKNGPKFFFTWKQLFFEMFVSLDL